jgi:hypothetical protein
MFGLIGLVANDLAQDRMLMATDELIRRLRVLKQRPTYVNLKGCDNAWCVSHCEDMNRYEAQLCKEYSSFGHFRAPIDNLTIVNKSQLLPLTIGPDQYPYIVIKRVVSRAQSITYESVRHVFDACGMGYATDLICDFINDDGIIIKNSQGSIIYQHSSPSELGKLVKIPIPTVHLVYDQLIVTNRGVSKYPLTIEFDILDFEPCDDDDDIFDAPASDTIGVKLPDYNMLFTHGVVKNMKKFERRQLR